MLFRSQLRRNRIRGAKLIKNDRRRFQFRRGKRLAVGRALGRRNGQAGEIRQVPGGGKRDRHCTVAAFRRAVLLTRLE